ncbi:MAG: hypothetical protein V4610_21940 [Pseudomonadota bacterium]|jgi:hypothetical protein
MIRQPSGPIEAKIPAGHAFFNLIEEAYRVFAYPKPGSIGVCERCCMDRKIEADFFKPNIRDLPLIYVQEWYFGAYDPKGLAKEIWAYLLPRILEILAAGEDVSNMGLEVSLNRFGTGDSGNWSEREWRVLDGFQKMFLREQIEQKRGFLDEIICMFQLAGWPLDTLLDQVASAPNPALALRLWNDWCRWPAPGNESIWITTFWECPDNTAVFDFYTSRRLYDKMEALALDDDSDGELAAKASAVASIIEANANWSLKPS